MRVTHISNSKSGGAGNVAYILNETMNKIDGVNSNFIYSFKTNIRNQPFHDPILTLLAAIDENWVKKRKFNSLFSLKRRNFNFNLYDSRASSEILHLHWLAGLYKSGIFSSESQNLKIVWTLHDMEPFTGGCHYSLGCLNFQESCYPCPAVKKIYQDKVKENFYFKMTKIKNLENLRIVVPSKWLKDISQKNSFFSNISINIIPNPIHESFIKLYDENLNKQKLTSNNNRFVIGFVSDRIENPIKKFSEFVKIIKLLSNKTKNRIEVHLIGYVGRNFKLDLEVPIKVFGNIACRTELAKCYSDMNLIVSSAESEAFGLTIAEAAGCGVIGLVNSKSASKELVEDGKSGFHYSDNYEAARLIEGIIRDSTEHKMSIIARTRAKNLWSPSRITNDYLDLYKEFLNKV